MHERATTADGLEVSFATNTLGPFALTRLLEPALERAGPGSKIIFVASGGAYTERLEVDDLEMARGRFDGTVQYARDKRRQMALAEQFAARLEGRGVG